MFKILATPCQKKVLISGKSPQKFLIFSGEKQK